jgi:hypothetical protein
MAAEDAPLKSYPHEFEEGIARLILELIDEDLEGTGRRLHEAITATIESGYEPDRSETSLTMSTVVRGDKSFSELKLTLGDGSEYRVTVKQTRHSDWDLRAGGN